MNSENMDEQEGTKLPLRFPLHLTPKLSRQEAYSKISEFGARQKSTGIFGPTEFKIKLDLGAIYFSNAYLHFDDRLKLKEVDLYSEYILKDHDLRGKLIEINEFIFNSYECDASTNIIPVDYYLISAPLNDANIKVVYSYPPINLYLIVRYFENIFNRACRLVLSYVDTDWLLPRMEENDRKRREGKQFL